MRRLTVLVLALLAGCGGSDVAVPERPSAARAGALPGDGPASVGGVELPAGRRVGDALWATDESPQDAFALWSRLAAAFPQTGLWPLVLETPAGEMEWEPVPGWRRDADRDGLEVLQELWERNVENAGELEELGRGDSERRDGAEKAAYDEMPTVAGLALVPVTRPADAPAAMGWWGPVNWFEEIGLTAAVLRSWEERYDAIPVGLGIDTMYVALRRPAEGEQAYAAAREVYAFAPDLVLQGTDSFVGLADALEGERAWPLWWD